MMIASITIAHDARFATRNDGDFWNLPLEIINPWS
jgi:hypothetical protein